MRVTFSLFSVCLFAAIIASAQVPVKKTVDKKDPAEIARRREQALAKVGGLITKPASGPSVLFLNTQKRFDAEQFQKMANTIIQAIRIKGDAKTESSETTCEQVRKMAADQKVGVLVWLCDNGDTHPSLLHAPEDGWIKINVSALAADKPTDEKLAERVQKQMWRAFGLAVGGGYANPQFPCLMQPTRSLKELDALTKVFSAQTMQRVMQYCDALGMKPARRVSYKKACEEGWAPAPTNAIQRAVWEATRQVTPPR
jgi:hypothetical protein